MPEQREAGASKPIRHKPVEAHVLFCSFADKTALNLCRNTHHEPARIGAASRSTDAAS
jgi:hypothetical protein